MLSAVNYTYQGQHYEVHFKHAHAMLPVKLKSGNVTLIPWGRRKNQQGKLPYGANIHLNTIHAGVWNVFNPKPVKIKLDSFMVLDYENKPRWYECAGIGNIFQGLLASVNYEQRVYIVVIEPDIEVGYHPVWPKIIK